MDGIMALISDPQAWIALVTLAGLEIVLGVDNIIFIAILVSRLPEEKRRKASILGLSLAMGTRVVLLLSLFWIMKLTTPLFSLFDHNFSGRDLILLFGGLFLMAKATLEIHHSIDPQEEKDKTNANAAKSFGGVLIQIAFLDIIFSLDSVITAVGMVSQVEIMILAVVIAALIMMLASKTISDFIEKHPTLKMMALAFLILVGVALMGEGLGMHIPKGYIYFSMAFALTVESLNIYAKSKKRQKI
ncbi:MAG: TerC family protein [Helicobacteraceae bacterium]|jgi:predicted tellurium resistance membrane protein TerC|nr:TerC family protein [Helicobacteraceae bacterium]